MEKSTSLSTKDTTDESDSNWSDINSSDETNDYGERSLHIAIDEDIEIPSSAKKSPPVRRHSVVSFTATSGSSKKSKM